MTFGPDDDTAVSPAPAGHLEHPIPIAQAWINPARFFSSSSLQTSWKFRFALMMVIGVGATLERLYVQPNSTAGVSKTVFFAVGLPLGGLCIGALHWYLAGLWFRMRLRFCGKSGAAREETNLINALGEGPAYAFSVGTALPFLAVDAEPFSVFRTPLPPAFQWGTTMLWFWAIYMNHEAARVRFNASKKSRLVWFVAAPIVFHVGVFVWIAART